MYHQQVGSICHTRMERGTPMGRRMLQLGNQCMLSILGLVRRFHVCMLLDPGTFCQRGTHDQLDRFGTFTALAYFGSSL